MAPSTKAIFNRNRDFQRQPRPNFPCMGSGNRNHHHGLQIAVAVAVDQNFLIFGGRSLKSRLRLLWCMGRSDQILLSASKTMLYSPGHQSRGPTLLRTAIQLRKIEHADRSLRVWVDNQQQSQPRSGCTSRLRLKIAVVDGALKSNGKLKAQEIFS